MAQDRFNNQKVQEANGVIPTFTLCECGRIAKDHCEAFVEKIWYGCKKVVSGEDKT